MAQEHKGRLVYLASPYSSPDKALQEYRFAAAALACGWLMDQYKDLSFFSPITHTHPIAVHCKLPGYWQFWAAYDRCMLSRCDELWVLCIDGWRTSNGVTAELKIARETGMPIHYVVPAHPDEYTITEIEPDEKSPTPRSEEQS